VLSNPVLIVLNERIVLPFVAKEEEINARLSTQVQGKMVTPLVIIEGHNATGL